MFPLSQLHSSSSLWRHNGKQRLPGPIPLSINNARSVSLLSPTFPQGRGVIYSFDTPAGPFQPIYKLHVLWTSSLPRLVSALCWSLLCPSSLFCFTCHSLSFRSSFLPLPSLPFSLLCLHKSCPPFTCDLLSFSRFLTHLPTFPPILFISSLPIFPLSSHAFSSCTPSSLLLLLIHCCLFTLQFLAWYIFSSLSLSFFPPIHCSLTPCASLFWLHFPLLVFREVHLGKRRGGRKEEEWWGLKQGSLEPEGQLILIGLQPAY